MIRLISIAMTLLLLGTWAPGARAEDAAAPVPSGKSERAPRILAGVGLGLLGGVAGFAIGFGGTELLTRGGVGGDDCGDSCGIDRLGWMVLGGVVGATAGVSLGTYAGSEWVGGDGSLGSTFIGGVVGSAVAVGLALAEGQGDAPGELIALTLVVPPLFGAALGYELSSSEAQERKSADAGAFDRPGFSATLGVAPIAGGAQLGLSGSF